MVADLATDHARLTHVGVDVDVVAVWIRLHGSHERRIREGAGADDAVLSAGSRGSGWTTGPATPFGAMWMCAATMSPGRLLAISIHSTVPVASSTTMATKLPLAAFVAAAHPGTSSPLVRAATKVLAGGLAPKATVAAAERRGCQNENTKELFHWPAFLQRSPNGFLRSGRPFGLLDSGLRISRRYASLTRATCEDDSSWQTPRPSDSSVGAGLQGCSCTSCAHSQPLGCGEAAWLGGSPRTTGGGAVGGALSSRPLPQ